MKRLAYILVAISLMVGLVGVIGCGEAATSPEEFATQEVTETSVRDTIQNLSGTGVKLEGNIIKIEIVGNLGTEAPNDKIVDVYYKPEVWDEEDAMTTAVHTAIKTMEVLFSNPKVSEVVMWQQGEFTDKYGNTKTELAIRIVMDREVADKIADWETVDDRAWSDYNTFFDLAELQYVHPAIAKAL